MKKVIIVLCIILAVGIAVSVTGLIIYAANGGNDMSNYEKIEKKATLNADGKIEISGKVESVNVYATDGEQLELSYYDGKKLSHEYSDDGGNVTLKTSFHSWFFGFWFHFDPDKIAISVGVPRSFKGELDLSGATGDITVRGIEGLSELEANVSTGAVTVENVKAEKCKLTATTGYVNVNGLTAAGDVLLKSTTGAVKAYGVTTKGLVKTEVTTGKTEIEADCGYFRAKSTTGGVNMTIKNAEEIEANCTTGSITGKIYGSEKDFDIAASTTTGSSNVSDRTTENGRKLRVTTTTGSISIKFIEE